LSYSSKSGYCLTNLEGRYSANHHFKGADISTAEPVNLNILPCFCDKSTSNIQDVTLLNTLEYYLTAYKYFNDSQDRYHILDENFDRAIVYNTEQCSGLLKLNKRDYERPSLILSYPSYTLTGVDVEVVKKEQKYRLNQFKDLIKNRGQFSLNWIPIWITEENGYKKVLNPSAIDYTKPSSERKLFRHNIHQIILRKNISGNVKFLLALSNDKQVKSFR